MIDNDKIKEYSTLLKDCEKAKQEAQNLKTELTLLKNQGIEKLKEKGYKSLSDIDKLNEEIAQIESEIEADIPKMRDYIASVNQKKEAKERILMG